MPARATGVRFHDEADGSDVLVVQEVCLERLALRQQLVINRAPLAIVTHENLERGSVALHDGGISASSAHVDPLGW